MVAPTWRREVSTPEGCSLQGTERSQPSKARTNPSPFLPGLLADGRSPASSLGGEGVFCSLASSPSCQIIHTRHHIIIGIRCPVESDSLSGKVFYRRPVNGGGGHAPSWPHGGARFKTGVGRNGAPPSIS